MKCLFCDSNNLIETKVRRDSSHKGVNFDYVANVTKCESCGEESSTPTQMKANLVAHADGYRQKMKLLTSREIIALRKKLNMTQEKFAEFLFVGVATLKRWEGNGIQDSSMDHLIRLSCDASAMSSQHSKLVEAENKNNIDTGFRPFNFKLFANIVAKISPLAPSALFYYKELFYIDFLNFKRYGKGITGLSYSALEYGPIPLGYEHFENQLITNDLFIKSGRDLVPKIEFDAELFTNEELSTIDEAFELLKQKGKQFILKKVHKEPAYLSYEHSGSVIPYSEAKTLILFGEQ